MGPYAKVLLTATALLSVTTEIAVSATNCSSALGQIARSTADKAISDNKDTACNGLKSGNIGIDKTKELKITEFSLCEDGMIIEATLAVFVKCATSDAAVIKAQFSETLKASAKADLDSCKVLSADVSANGFLGKLGLKAGDANKKLTQEIEKAMSPYCKKQ